MAESPHALDREQRLDEVVAEYLEGVESGTAPDRAELLRRHPDLAEELAAFFADQDQFDSLVAPLRSSGGTLPHTPADDVPRVPRSFGDYEVLGEIARGGMGVVYKARQLSLNRVVALKMILRGELASAEEVQRFRLEAEAAAGLDHPNIVPIHEVGEHEGQPYFSMKLIEGGNLGQHVGRLVGRPREAARLITDVARAVHYAHQHGILHRDLKPANVLLDREGTPYVTDFGLAKRVAGTTAPTAPSLTHSGAAVGTPSYMAPEQASGRKDALTTAADIYSLGAILYELLTGRPPFKADTPLNTLVDVLHREPVPPRSLRAGIDRDLETICLKCLQKEPARRYASAGALADDLQRYLDGETILARPVGRVERLGRWCRRNPALTAAGAVAVVGLAAAAVVSCLLAWSEARHAARQAQAAADLRVALDQAERHAREAQDRATEADRERARAAESFRQAHQAVHDCLSVSEELAYVPGVQPLCKKLLASTLTYYQKFLRERGDDPGLRAELAQTYYDIGVIASDSGDQTRAADALRRALALYQALAHAQPKDPRWQADLLHTWINLAKVQGTISQSAAARESVRNALEIAERLVRERPGEVAYVHDLASVYQSLAIQDEGAADYRQAVEHIGQARLLFEQLLCLNPHSQPAQGDLALCINNLGVFHARLDQRDAALRCFEEARAIREKLAAETPPSSPHHLGLAASYRDLALQHEHLGHRDEAIRFYEQAHAIRARLALEHPGVTQYQSDLASSLNDLGYVYLANHQPKAALDYHQQALHIQRDLTRLDPKVSAWQSDLARSYCACGEVLASVRQDNDAVRAYQSARELQEKLIARDPGQAGYQHNLADTLRHLGRVLSRLGRPDDALAALRQAVEHQRVAVQRAPQVGRYRRALAGHCAALAKAARERGRADEATDVLLECRQLAGDDPQELYRVACNLALTAASTDEAARHRAADLAVETLRQAVAHGYRDAGRLRDDPNLAGVRGRDDFQGLLAALGK
jgi:serine/threonine-protein kinase